MSCLALFNARDRHRQNLQCVSSSTASLPETLGMSKDDVTNNTRYVLVSLIQSCPQETYRQDIVEMTLFPGAEARAKSKAQRLVLQDVEMNVCSCGHSVTVRPAINAIPLSWIVIETPMTLRIEPFKCARH